MNISLLCALVTFGSSAFFCLPVSSQVIGQQKISNTAGNLGNFLEADARFGRSVTYLDDLNSNLVNELVVGADLANSTAGEVWVIFLDTDGKAQNGFPPVHIENGSGGLPWNALAVDDRFGFSCTEIGDLNGDGTQDLAVGAHGTDFGVMPNQDKGCVWILFMDPNNPGYVESTVQLKENQNGAPPVFDQSENFGTSIECIGDLDGDGVQDLAVGADPGLGSFSFMGGRVWILFMNSNGTIKDYFEIAEGVGGFSGGLGLNSRFGCDISLIGDLDNDQIPELAVGATGVDDAGAIYILFMNTDGSVRKNSKISNLAGNWSGGQSGDKFGKGLSWNPNKQQLISGASSYDGPNGNRNNVGQQWLLNLSSAGVEIGRAHV